MKETIFITWDKCSTCRRAQKYLDDNGINYIKRDIMENNPTAEELTVWIKESGLPIKRFFNTSGVVYREQKLKDKLPNMNEQEQIQLLASTGRLLKRPILLGEHGVFVGFNEELYETIK
ncbi:MAG: arsenate reductase family protein [Erysipelothrix sp.]|nr:arsenate reductase family protein [Erysipelothrix sp.]